MLPAIEQFKGKLHGKAVILRVDFNVQISPAGKIMDDYRICAAMPTIIFLRNQGAKLILVSHRGRPKKSDPALSLKPLAGHLAKVLRQKVLFFEQHPRELKNLIPLLPAGGMIMLENLRFWPGEEANDKKFAKDLATLGEVFVNDAFAVSHRKNASLVAITRYLPSYAGMLLEKEIKNLDKILKIKARPFLAIFGGAKLSDKLPLIERFIKRADWILTGGGVANTLLKSQNVEIGQSIFEPKLLKTSTRLLKTAKEIVLPQDFVAAKNHNSRGGRVVGTRNVARSDKILDIGPGTRQRYIKMIEKARMILWNGPLGYIENPAFARGSYSIARAIAKNRRAFSVVGGGETVDVIRNLKLENRIGFLSTGGGAMLEYLAGKKLPGIEALYKTRSHRKNIRSDMGALNNRHS